MRDLRTFIAGVERTAALPPGDGERFAGYGVMGLPFRSGHILALRRFPASSIGPGYASVWHRDPDGRWTFYADADPRLACTRYFGAAVAETAVRAIRLRWTGPWSLSVSVDEGILEWGVTVAPAPAAGALNRALPLLPAPLWRREWALRLMGAVAEPMLRAGHLRLHGTAPNGQRLAMRPRLVWTIPTSRAVWRGIALGPVGPVPEQARLGDFWLPQRGLFIVGAAAFEAFDPARHRDATGGAPAPAAATPPR
jgi:hypothetical protein